MPTSTEGNNISNLNNELNKSTDLTNSKYTFSYFIFLSKVKQKSVILGMDQKPTMIRKPNNVYVNSGETSISKKYSFFTIYISYMLINLCYYTLFSFRYHIKLFAHILYEMITKSLNLINISETKLVNIHQL